MTRPLNLLYFHCHDLGRFIGAYGRGYTPALDRFAENAIVFERAFCASPPCSPSRACALTGKTAHRNGCLGLSHLGWPLPLSEMTLVDDLRAVGYQTALCGVNHERHPRTDRYEIDRNHGWDDWRAERAVTHAITFLQERDPRRPFFLNVGTQEPHRSTWSHFQGAAAVDVTDAGWDRYPGTSHEFALFAAARREMDQAFGRLMDALRRLNLETDTLVVFTTDHGVYGDRAKGTLYSMGTEIALMLRLPGAHPGRRSDLISNVDFRPTFLELLGLSVPEALDGRSFAPSCLSGDEPPRRSPIFCEYNFHGKNDNPFRAEVLRPFRSVRDFRYHLIGDFTPSLGTNEPTARWELFDTVHDPDETNNVSGHPEQAKVEQRLQADLWDWMRRTNDYILAGERPSPPEPAGWGTHWDDPVDVDCAPTRRLASG